MKTSVLRDKKEIFIMWEYYYEYYKNILSIYIRIEGESNKIIFNYKILLKIF